MNHELVRDLDDYIQQKRYRLVNSVLLYKDGALALERYYNKYNKNSRNNIKSIWKSILSGCTGICLDNGYIESLDEPISNYLKEFGQNNHPYHKRITIRHLLTMTSGIYWNRGIHYQCPMLEQLLRSKNLCVHLADIHMVNLPGTTHVYKEWDVILLSALIGVATGMNVYNFCNEFLYKPLKIESGPWWTSPCGVTYNIGNNKVEQAKSDLSAHDLAKIGFLLLDGGHYNGRQIVSREYIKQAITPSEQNPAYGLMWWIGDDWYGCRGHGGQEITVVPKKNMVYVIQAAPSARKSYGDVFDFLIKHISISKS